MKNQLSIIPIENRLENEIFIQKVLVTPELAKRLLSTMVINRNIKERALNKIVEDINTGSWVVNNGETLKINNQGRLIDGQHRLTAIITTKKPMELYITFNVDANSINTVDTGAVRSLTNILKINGIKYYTIIGGIVQSESVILKGTSVRNISNATNKKGYLKILDSIKKNEEYLYFVCKQADKLNNSFALIPINFYSKYFNILYKIDKYIAMDFFSKLTTGIDCDPSIYLLRDALIKDASKNIKKFSLKEKEALFIKCWNHYIDGNDLKSLRWQASSEPFPKLKRIELITELF